MGSRQATLGDQDAGSEVEEIRKSDYDRAVDRLGMVGLFS